MEIRQHACLCSFRCTVASVRRGLPPYSAACSESVRSRGDTLNIIDMRVCNDSARATTRARTADPKRERGRSSIVGDRGSSSMIDTWVLFVVSIAVELVETREITRGIIPYSLRIVSLNIALRKLTIISVFATAVAVQLRSVRSSRVISRGFRDRTQIRRGRERKIERMIWRTATVSRASHGGNNSSVCPCRNAELFYVRFRKEGEENYQRINCSRECISLIKCVLSIDISNWRRNCELRDRIKSKPDKWYFVIQWFKKQIRCFLFS